MSPGCFPSNSEVSAVPQKSDVETLRDMILDLQNRTVSIELLYTTRQTIETWQTGCEVQLNNILSSLQTQSEHHSHHKHRIDAIKGAIEYFIKRLDEVTDRVTGIEQRETQQKFNLPSIGELNKIVEQELKPCCDSKEHIERFKKLVNDTLQIKKMLHNENKELLEKNNILADCLDRKQAEVNGLTKRLNELVNKFNEKVGGHL